MNDVVDLESFVVEYLKRRKFERSSELLSRVIRKRNSEEKTSRTMVKFRKYLMELDKKIKQEVNDDLGFEINFGAGPTSVKYPVKQEAESPRKVSKVKKKRSSTVPQDFIDMMKKFGFKEESANVLYETKADWTALQSENKIYCTVRGCKFTSEIYDDCLTEHCAKSHQWGEYPCDAEYCEYVGYSKASVNMHKAMHTRLFDTSFQYKCPYKNCQSSFKTTGQLDGHLSIHRNDLEKCEFCLYRYWHKHDYKDHLKSHFQIRDNKCDKCDKTFMSARELTIHYQHHEGIDYICTLCQDQKVCKTKKNASVHFKDCHSVVSQHSNWSIIEKYFVKE